MSDSVLNLSPTQFAKAFPFHIVLDECLHVLQSGSVLSRLCPGLTEGAEFSEHFIVQRPLLQRMDFDAIRQHDNSLFVLQHREGSLRLRGEFIAHDRRLFFLGSPWVAEMVDVGRIGLSLSDFSLHDPVVDLLFLLQTKNKGLADSQGLSRRLRASQQRLAEAQELAKLGSWVLDPRTGKVECSDEARRIYGFTATAANPTLARLLALMPELQRAGLREAVEHAEQNGAPVELEHRVHAADGTDRWVHVNLQRSTENGLTTVRATVRDETTRKTSALRLALAHDIARELAGDVEPDSAAAFILSSIGAQLGWHAAVCWVVGDDAQVRCLEAWAVAGDAGPQEFVAAMRGFSGPRQGGNLEAGWAAANPPWRVIRVTGASQARDNVAGRCGLHAAVVVPVIAGTQLVALEFFSRAPIGVDLEIEAFMRSIASQMAQYLRRKQAETALRHVAYHDALTGLASRPLLHERLAHAIQRATRDQGKVAVLFMDLDRFKHVNDSLGHSAGDVLLRACADRLREGVRESDTVARFGGDEFVLVLEGLNSAVDAITPLTKLLNQFRLPFEVNGRELPTTASIGISVFPDDGQDAETLLMNADAAMYRAKEKGPGNHHFYSAQMNMQGKERLTLESCLHRALERDELFLVYQPKLNIATGQITGSRR